MAPSERVGASAIFNLEGALVSPFLVLNDCQTGKRFFFLVFILVMGQHLFFSDTGLNGIKRIIVCFWTVPVFVV